MKKRNNAKQKKRIIRISGDFNMGNPLFQQAKEAAAKAKEEKTERAIAVAKNALSSAFANANDAERRQLHDLQDELDTL